ncbi:TPA: hypothetical protein HA235_01155 [Candidatus Woesearchaeota archaeon]|nr:hypothetical protein [Candidatus Woesearchaeota archaeon]HIH31291.1 hypothetical protein [Candidatus Woesearchaeota archaeon]HIH55132.1 hypothetical protein [Candidatus Woesearchaeota archaeon]HIJ01808.1 hypothetical protein [Candidatus Woesearchaeota archaeon]HIJ14437.1 hypothetical protein [Candidatus Woesearchaeota archaeon]
MERIFTLEKFAEEKGLAKQSALNLLSKMKKQNLVHTSGGAKQKRLYKVFDWPQRQTNGFYDIINRYSPEKLVPKFQHYAYGRYNIENAIIDGLKLGDIRTKEATMHLFRHVKNWKVLFELAEKEKLKKELITLHNEARKIMRVKKMPERYK